MKDFSLFKNSNFLKEKKTYNGHKKRMRRKIPHPFLFHQSLQLFCHIGSKNKVIEFLAL